jgi:hypothetical protein
MIQVVRTIGITGLLTFWGGGHWPPLAPHLYQEFEILSYKTLPVMILFTFLVCVMECDIYKSISEV